MTRLRLAETHPSLRIMVVIPSDVYHAAKSQKAHSMAVRQPTTTQNRHCPQCFEVISSKARICRYCHSDIQASESQALSQWLRSHPTLTIALATFLYVTFRVYEAADFDVNNMLRILHASGLTTILIGVLLVQLPAELLLLILAACWWLHSAATDAAQSSPPGTRAESLLTGSRTSPVLLLGIFIFLSYVIVSWPFFLISLLIVGITLFISRRAMKTRSNTTETKPISRKRGLVRFITLRRSLVVLAIAVLFYAIDGPAIWVDAETITTTDHGEIVGYVIDDSGTWTTILTPTWTGFLRHGNSVIMEKAENITKRELCAITIPQPSIFGLKMYRPIQLWQAWITHRPVPTLSSRCQFPGGKAK
jgi:hypothetical protein